MHRIDAADHVGNLFSNGPPGTQIDDHFMNAVQQELCNVIELAGIALVKGTHTQLKAAIDAYIAAAVAAEEAARASADTTHANLTNPHSATDAATASRLVLRDAAGRAKFADPSAAADAATKGYVEGLPRIVAYGLVDASGNVTVSRGVAATAPFTNGVSAVTLSPAQPDDGYQVFATPFGAGSVMRAYASGSAAGGFNVSRVDTSGNVITSGGAYRFVVFR